MKRVVALIISMMLMVASASVACAAVDFEDKTISFTNKSAYGSIVSDSTSKAKEANTDYARLYITNNTSSVNSVFRTYYNGSYVSREYFKRETAGTWMYYNTNVPAEKYVNLRGRPDSSVSTCKITGSFGAG